MILASYPYHNNGLNLAMARSLLLQGSTAKVQLPSLRTSRSGRRKVGLLVSGTRGIAVHHRSEQPICDGVLAFEPVDPCGDESYFIW